jgi:hypothetical protein
MKYFKQLLLSLTIISCIAITKAEIRFVFNMISNGASSPTSDHLNSINEDVFGERWDNPNHLTPIGMRMQYLLGRRNRVKYTNFISSSYTPQEVVIQSTKFNNTLSSAQAHLQGLFPQGTGPNLSGYQRNVAYPPQGKTGYGDFVQEVFGAPALPYNTQIFPIQTYSDVEYQYFFMYNIKDNCQDAYYDMIDNRRTTTSKDLLSTIDTKYGAQLAQAIGADRSVFQDYLYTYMVMKDFVAGYVDGKLHKRLTDTGLNLTEFNQTATDFLHYDLYQVLNFGNDTEYLPEISFGVFASELLDQMDQRIDLDTSDVDYSETNPKLIISSVNEVIVASVLRYLEVELKTKSYFVPFASSLNFELKRPDGKDYTTLTEYDYFVDITFNDVSLKTVAYSEFRKFLKDAWSVRKTRWECSLTPFQYWGFQNSTITLGVLLGACVILIFLVICCWKCNGKNAHVLHTEDINLKI